MKLPALLGTGFAIVIGLGVYLLDNPRTDTPALLHPILLYPAAWLVIGAAFWGLNKATSGTPQPSGDEAETASE